MVDPLTALLVALSLIVALVLVLRPERGWLWQGLRALRATERARIEDALKHLFDCEYKGKQATLESVSGALAVSGNRAAEMLGRLEEQELIVSTGTGYELSPAGRSYALRIVRIHRLWERYLAEETGLDPRSWHPQAELREHTTSPEQVEALSARLGHPRYDPHGDPIPTAAGEIVPPEGRPLTELSSGDLAEIVHVEDEPQAVYDQLLAEGLHPGMRVRVVEVTPQRVRLEAEADEHVLAPVVAANVWGLALPREEELEGPFERLSSLALGQRGRVVGISQAMQGAERRRVLDLGLLPGTEVAAEIRSPGGDPTGYRIRGAVVALRRDQADQIQIERIA